MLDARRLGLQLSATHEKIPTLREFSSFVAATWRGYIFGARNLLHAQETGTAHEEDPAGPLGRFDDERRRRCRPSIAALGVADPRSSRHASEQGRFPLCVGHHRETGGPK